MSIKVVNVPAPKNHHPMTKSYSVEYGYLSQSRNLISDALFEEKVCETDAEENLNNATGDNLKVDINNNLVSLQNVKITCAEGEPTEEAVLNEESTPNTIYFILQEIPNINLSSLTTVFTKAQGMGCNITYIESRRCQESTNDVSDILFEVQAMSRKMLNDFVSGLRVKFPKIKIVEGKDLRLEKKTEESNKIWIPKHISDLDSCNHILVKFEPELHCSHPGYLDKEYRKRRADIVKLAFDYKHSSGPIPRVVYTDAENETWRTIYVKCKELHRKHACAEYNRVFAQLEKVGLFSPDFMPQLEDLSQFLQKTSGFQLRPAAGLLTARDFLASLAFRVFQATQYMRHTSSPWHTPEPDVIHEILGHIPMLADPDFAQMSQEIGLASLGASDQEIVKMATLYWFTVEFGLCWENGSLKAYGAGLMSSFGEFEHSLSGKPQLLPFDPEKTAVQAYQDETYQDIYFTTDSFKEAKEQLLKYTLKLTRPYEIFYDPYTQTVVEATNVNSIYQLANRLDSDTAKIMNALYKLGLNKDSI